MEEIKKKYQPTTSHDSVHTIPSLVSSQSRLLHSAEKPKRRLSKGYVSPYSTKSKEERLIKEKATPEKPDELAQKSQQWQLRLSGMSKTIKNLENTNKEKAEEMSALEKELSEKQKIIDSLQSRLEIDRNRSYVMQSAVLGSTSTTSQRTKERELEKKLRESELMVSKDKKQIMRLNEVNAQLLDRIKGNGAVLDERDKAEEGLKEHIKRLEQTIGEHQHENNT